MKEHLLRIATINYYDILLLTDHLNKIHKNNLSIENTKDLTDSQLKQYYLEIAEEFDSCNIIWHYNALSTILLSFVINKNFNFLLDENIEQNFNTNLIEKSIEYGLFEDLIKNLNYFYTKFLEFPKKESYTIKKLKLLFYMKINIFLIFIHLHFFRNKTEIINFIKLRGDELEEILLRLFKISTVHKFLPTRDLLCLHFIFIEILISNSAEEEKIVTCRKIEKKENTLNRENLGKFMKPEIPKFFINFEKSDQYIEKFYRKNIIKKEKSDLERVVIVNILKILLFTIENLSNTTANYEYARNYVSEVVLFSYYVNKFEFQFDKDLSEEEKENSEIPKAIFEEILFNNFSLPYIDLLNKISITSIIITFYFKILKKLQETDLIQFSHFAFQLIDSNGLLVFIKILNQDFNTLNAQVIKMLNEEIINIEFGYLIELILLYDLKLIHKICEKNDEFICDYLIQCKVYVMLKRILNGFSENEKINKICLKIFKSQIKFLDKNWRIENNNIISNIYLVLNSRKGKDETVENFLTFEKKDKNFKEPNPNYFTLEELKKIHLEYHNFNYLKYMNNIQEMENYQNSKFNSLYANLYLKMLSQADKLNEIKENKNN